MSAGESWHPALMGNIIKLGKGKSTASYRIFQIGGYFFPMSRCKWITPSNRHSSTENCSWLRPFSMLYWNDTAHNLWLFFIVVQEIILRFAHLSILHIFHKISTLLIRNHWRKMKQKSKTSLVYFWAHRIWSFVPVKRMSERVW